MFEERSQSVPMPVSRLLRIDWCRGRLADAVQRFLTTIVAVIGHSQKQTAVSRDRTRHDLIAHVVLCDLFEVLTRRLVDRDDAVFAGCVNVLTEQNR